MSDRILVPLLSGEWLALDAQTFAEALNRGAELIPCPASNDALSDAQLFTADEMAERTRVPKSWWLEAAKRDDIPHVRLGKYVRFPASILSATDGMSAAWSPGKQGVATLSAVKD